MDIHLLVSHQSRAALSNPDSRYALHQRVALDDGWGSVGTQPPPLRTELLVDHSRSVINYNGSPDVPFDRSLNPYRGCEHGCVYCFARPTHAYLGLSPGLDFESRIFHKPDAAIQLRRELSRAGYRCAPLAIGINTDAYQPVERHLAHTRAILEVLREFRHPFSIITKSALIERDIDLLAPLAAENLAHVALSVTTLDSTLARTLEPRAATAQRRLESIRRLRAAGIPVTVLIAPLIPALTDHELEAILAEVRAAGAVDAGYVLLRLPREVGELFQQWLRHHRPLQAERVINRMRDCRGGDLYDSRFGSRMRGSGPFAELLRRRFRLAYDRLGFADSAPLDCTRFRVPGRAVQLDLL